MLSAYLTFRQGCCTLWKGHEAFIAIKTTLETIEPLYLRRCLQAMLSWLSLTIKNRVLSKKFGRGFETRVLYFWVFFPHGKRVKESKLSSLNSFKSRTESVSHNLRHHDYVPKPYTSALNRLLRPVSRCRLFTTVTSWSLECR